MQKNVNEVLAQGKLPTYGTSIDQVVPQYSIVGAFGLCRKCVCLGRGDAKQFSAKTRKPENPKTRKRTGKHENRESRENRKTRKRENGQENAKTAKTRKPRKRENARTARTAKTQKPRKRHLYTMIYGEGYRR